MIAIAVAKDETLGGCSGFLVFGVKFLCCTTCKLSLTV